MSTAKTRKPPANDPLAAQKAQSAQSLTVFRAMVLKATGKKETPANFSTRPHIPSGSLIINSLIGGAQAADGKGLKCPGYPRRAISEVFGPESSGKTTIALAAAVEVQRAGGTVLFLDHEHAFDAGYAKSIGIDFESGSFMLYDPDTLEDGFKMMYSAVIAGIDMIIVDSVAAMVPQLEMEKKVDEAMKVGIVAGKMAQHLPKLQTFLATYPKIGSGDTKKKDPDRPGTAIILLNQERAKIETGGHGGGDGVNTTGGKAVKFYASLRLRFSRTGSESVERMDPLTGKKKKFPYGNKTRVRVVKNKIDGTQGQEGDFFIRYGYGLDNYYSVIETGVALGVLRKDSAYYQYETHRIQGRDKFRTFLVENPKVYDEICAKVGAVMASSGTAVKDEELGEEDALLADMPDLGDSGDSAAELEVVEADDAYEGAEALDEGEGEED